MKRLTLNLTSIRILIVLAFSLAGCGGGGGGDGGGGITSFTVTATAGANGTVSPTTATVNQGNTTSIMVTPDAGFQIDAVSGCGGSFSGTTYTTSAITANCTVTASFSAITFTVTATAGANGTVSPTTAAVNQGNTTSITVTPDAGFQIDAVSGCGGSLSGTTYTTVAITASCTVTASFSAITFTVTATAGMNGTVSPITAAVNQGNTTNIAVTPDAGFQIDEVSGCGGSLSGTSYTTSAITADCMVTASFRKIVSAWKHRAYDTANTSYYPFSSVPNGGGLALLWEDARFENAHILTEDMDGDGVLDIVAWDGSTMVALGGGGTDIWSVQTTARLDYIGDLDGDGLPEICLSHRDNANRLKIDIYNHDGSLDKTIDSNYTGSDVRMNVLTSFGDHLLVGYYAGFARTPRGIGVIRYELGTEDAFYATGGGGMWGTFGIGDSDGDGLPEIALPWGTPHNGASANGTTDRDLYSVLLEADIEANPATLTAKFTRSISSWNSGTNPNGFASAMMPDLDGDGLSEVLFLEGHDSTFYPGSHHVYSVTTNGHLLSTWRGDENGKFPLGTVIPDLTGDGVMEIVMSARDSENIHVIDGTSLSQIQSKNGAGRVLGATDFDGDNQVEIIVHSSATGQVQVLRSDNLAVVSTWNLGSLTPIGFDRDHRFAISDITGDESLELIFGASSGVVVLRGE